MLLRSQSATSLSRTYASSSGGYAYTPPTPITISVDKCTSKPGFGQRFSYCRYTTNPYATTYYAYNPSMSVLEDTRSRRDVTTDALNNTFNVYLAKMAVRPRYGFNIDRTRSSSRDRDSDDVDRAVSSYQTRSTAPNYAPMSKYWMTPRYWESEREKARQKAHSWAIYR